MGNTYGNYPYWMREIGTIPRLTIDFKKLSTPGSLNILHEASKNNRLSINYSLYIWPNMHHCKISYVIKYSTSDIQ